VSPVDDQLYAELMAPRAAAWQARATRAAGERKVTYALRRSAALRRPYSSKLASCRRRGIRVKCGCRGWRGFRPWTCRQALACRHCAGDRCRRMGARMRSGLQVALQPPQGFRPGRLVLLTLSVRHSGSVERDRAELADGWRAFRKAYWRKYGWFPFCGVYEVTPGVDGLGHIHGHVAVVWPWRDWHDIREMWLAACPSSERITLVADRRDGRQSTAGSVANYLAKYLAKGSQGEEFTPELLTRVIAGTYNTRWVFSSRGFWQIFEPLCKRCNCAITAAQFRWNAPPLPPWGGPDSERGPPQLDLSIPAPDERGCCRRA
jgi:hypothetical protein